MQHLDEGTIHAWLDGALTSEEAARAEAHAASCTRCADAVAEARGLIAASSRILTALDNVPNVRGAKGAKGAEGAQWGRRSLGWLVRERIAAVVALVVAGGALTLVMTRGMPNAAEVRVASEPVPALELAEADSPPPPAVARQELRIEGPTSAPVGTRVAQPRVPGAGIGSGREADSAPPPSLLQQAPLAAVDAAAASRARTDDMARSVTVAEAHREEARDLSAQGSPSAAEKVVAGLSRRRAAETSTRFAEPRAAPPAVGVAGGAAAPAAVALAVGPRLVQEETMTEGGREIRRRIYRADNLLVTLDERRPGAADEAMSAQAANAPRPDSAITITAIRWTDARGAEFTLTGPAPQERLERIRKLLGY